MQFEIIVDERCFKTIEEFDNYTWQKDKDTGEYTNEPVDTIIVSIRCVIQWNDSTDRLENAQISVRKLTQ